MCVFSHIFVNFKQISIKTLLLRHIGSSVLYVTWFISTYYFSQESSVMSLQLSFTRCILYTGITYVICKYLGFTSSISKFNSNWNAAYQIIHLT